ncbi:hypothetical protein M9Y10_011948 [Tritrichomonas musculus]|uniref:Uncharacterized protein n=1 Tax=Tritrichomonas musculus TaxID=1915356 RepID=A0ABR2ICC4_9EUKA
MKNRNEQPQMLEITDLVAQNPDNISKANVYYTISNCHPKNDLEFLTLSFFISTIVDFSLNEERYGYTLLDILSSLVQNPVLSPIYYSLNLAKAKKLKLDPKVEQIIEFYESFRQVEE